MTRRSSPGCNKVQFVSGTASNVGELSSTSVRVNIGAGVSAGSFLMKYMELPQVPNRITRSTK
jgi:hypothetical protein